MHSDILRMVRFAIIAAVSVFALAGAQADEVWAEVDTIDDELIDLDSTRESSHFFKKFSTRRLFAGIHLVGSVPAPLDYKQFTLGPVAAFPGIEGNARICVSVDSLDTLYTGSAIFVAVPPVSGTRVIPLKSQYQDILIKKFDSDGVVFRALMAADCRNQGEGYFVAVGVTPDPTHLEIIVAMKQGALELHLSIDENTFSEFECDEVDVPQGYRCRMPLTQLRQGEYNLVATITHPRLDEPIIRSARIATPKSDD